MFSNPPTNGAKRRFRHISPIPLILFINMSLCIMPCYFIRTASGRKGATCSLLSLGSEKVVILAVAALLSLILLLHVKPGLLLLELILEFA